MMSVILLSVTVYCYAECRYAECRSALARAWPSRVTESQGALIIIPSHGHKY